MPEYYIEAGTENIDIEKIRQLLEKTYWAAGRTSEEVKKSVENSVCFSAFDSNTHEQIGFARAVTDYVSIYWLCDVVVDPQYKGLGIGKKLVESVVTNETLKNLTGILSTNDAHGLYEQYGFKRSGDRFMRKPRNSAMD